MKHCGHARYVWNLCVEQQSEWRPWRGRMPGFAERCRQLTEARADNPWLAAGSVTVQQQAIKDHYTAMRSFDVIRVEDLKLKSMTRSAKGTAERPGRNVAQKAALNHGILRSGWGILVRRLEEKAHGRIEKVPPAYTSQRCSACGHIARESRKNQALYQCVTCGFTCNADVNAARNIAAGRAVKARGGDRDTGPLNREPQLALLSA